MRPKEKYPWVLFLTFLLLASSPKIVWGQTYLVKPGDTLYRIASNHNTTVTAIQQLNGLTSLTIYPGQVLEIPSPAKVITHRVQAGENLYQIAKRYQVTEESIRQANHLTENRIYLNQLLVIPNNLSPAAPAPAPAPKSENNYIVQNGDTLFGIAKNHGIPVERLCAANNFTENTIIHPGQTLYIPKNSMDTDDQTIPNHNPNPYRSIQISQEEVDLLARLVTAEARSEPLEGQVAVVTTVLNRVLDPRYPDTVHGVIYHIYKGRYQFSPVTDGRINQPATPSAYQAIQLGLSGWDPSKGAKGFYNPTKSTDAWARSQTVTATIGNHVFICY